MPTATTIPTLLKSFDTEKPFEFVFGERTIHVRYPTDAELIKRQKATQTIMRTLNSGDTVPERPDLDKQDEADLALFNSIHLDPDVEVDVDTALRVITILDNGSIKSVKLDGTQWVVHLRILGGFKGAPSYDTYHILRDPTFRDERRYKALTSFRTMRGGRFKVETYLPAAGDLYGSLKLETHGYTGEIPITHQNAVLDAVMRKVIETSQEVEADDEVDQENL